jgi:hypothetical protein
MLLWMLAAAIRRVEEHGRRRVWPLIGACCI